MKTLRSIWRLPTYVAALFCALAAFADDPTSG
jgi:hypothetical protein